MIWMLYVFVWVIFASVTGVLVLKYLDGTLNCFFGNHPYEVIERAYSHPNETVKPTHLSIVRDPYTGEVLTSTGEKLVHGYTTLIFQCKNCKKLHREEMLGKSSG